VHQERTVAERDQQELRQDDDRDECGCGDGPVLRLRGCRRRIGPGRGRTNPPFLIDPSACSPDLQLPPSYSVGMNRPPTAAAKCQPPGCEKIHQKQSVIVENEA
jgi:hypothetical protein